MIIAVDGGDLPLGGGLLAILRPALALVEPGGVVAIRSTRARIGDELASWCRVERHIYVGTDEAAAHLIARGKFGVARVPDRIDGASGFAPPGAAVEPGGPVYPFTILDAALPDVAQLRQQSLAAQWTRHEIAWDSIGKLPRALDAAVAQIFSFLAENELAALYVPAKFLPRLHPAHLETASLLAANMNDEARHIDVFLDRSRRSGGPGVSSATTSRSLHSLLVLEDFLEASFLLAVLGEGTFLDLLRFVERHAPDEPTADIARRARADEARHVHFGLAHIRHALANDPSLFARLEAAVKRRAASFAEPDGVPAPIADALVILGARGDDPASVARGHEAFRELLGEMKVGRLKRLTSAGFSTEQAEILAGLHTPNFM